MLVLAHMVVTMPNTKIKSASPAVPSGARIPVFEELRQGQFVFVGYVVTKFESAQMKKAA